MTLKQSKKFTELMFHLKDLEVTIKNINDITQYRNRTKNIDYLSVVYSRIERIANDIEGCIKFDKDSEAYQQHSNETFRTMRKMGNDERIK